MELTLFVDHQCNLRCTYCYNGEKFSRRMPLSVMQQAVELGFSRGAPSIDLGFFGGEPLLHFDFLLETERCVARTLAALPAPHPQVRWVVNTNGTRFSDEVIEWLAPPRRTAVFVSLDGPRAVHDRVRLTAAGQGSYERIVEGLGRLRERKIPFHLVAVVGAENAVMLGDTVRELAGLGPERITLAPNFRDDWSEDSIAGLRTGLGAAADCLIGRFRQGSALVVDPFHTKILTHLKGGIPCPSRCLIAGNELCIAPSGRIYPCAQMIGEDRTGALAIGHVESGLDRSRIAELQVLKDRVEETCRPCALRDRCQSQCGCRHLALSGQLGDVTATLCETEAAFIECADSIAETLYAEQNPAFIDLYYRRAWGRAAGGQLTPLRRARDA